MKSRKFKMMKISGVYEIRNIFDNHRYIGSSIDIKKRWQKHKLALNNYQHRNSHLQRAWNKYGENAFIFVTLLVCDIKNLILYEQICINKFKPRYNIALIAGSCLGVKCSEEKKEKIIAKLSGKKRPPEVGLKVSIANKGRKHTCEARVNMSLARMGKKRSVEHCNNISLGRKGIVFTEEHKKNISLALTGRRLAPEHCAKMLGRIPWNKGKTGVYSNEALLKMSFAKTGKTYPIR